MHIVTPFEVLPISITERDAELISSINQQLSRLWTFDEMVDGFDVSVGCGDLSTAHHIAGYFVNAGWTIASVKESGFEVMPQIYVFKFKFIRRKIGLQ